MNKLACSSFLALFFLDYLAFGLKVLPRAISWAPEILSLLILAVLALYLAKGYKIALDKKYLVLLSLYLFLILAGIVINGLSFTTIFVGARVYLKHLPYFLLPAVACFTDSQLKKQLKLLFFLLVLQCPISLFQRFIQFRKDLSGDAISGTLGLSGTLSAVMLCSIAVLFAFYLKKKISLRFFLIAALCLFLPTTINETKVTLLLLPIAILVPVLFTYQGSRLKAFFVACTAGCLLVGVFVPIYDSVAIPGQGIMDMFTAKTMLKDHYFLGNKYGKIDPKNPDYSDKRLSYEDYRRGDSIKEAVGMVTKSPLHFIIGLGIGNVKRSFDKSLNGEYATLGYRHGAYAILFSNLIWEIGLAGLTIFMLFYYFIFRDAVFLAKFNDVFGTFALGWAAVTAILTLLIFYSNYIHFNVINILFWYFSGVVANRAFGVRALARQALHRAELRAASRVPHTSVPA